MKNISKINVIFLLIGLVVGILTIILFNIIMPAKVEYLTGYATTNSTKSAIGFKQNRSDTSEEGYSLTAISKDINNAWSDSFPTCLKDSNQTKKVKLGIKKISGELGTRNIVVSVECLE